MKKILLLIFFTLFLFSKEFVVAFSQDNMGYIWKRIQISELQELFKDEKGMKFIYQDGESSIAKQISDIESFTKKRVDILIVSPAHAQAIVPALQKAYEKGIKIIFAIRNAQMQQYVSYIHPSDYAIGKEAALYIARKLKETRIVMLQGKQGANTVINRKQGFVDELSKHDNARIVADEVANYKREQALEKIEEIIKKGISFNAVYSHNDAMLDGVRVALKKNGIDLSTITLVGIDYILEAKRAISKGEQSATFTYPTCSNEIFQTVKKIFREEKVSKDIVIDSLLITQKNYKEIQPLF